MRELFPYFRDLLRILLGIDPHSELLTVLTEERDDQAGSIAFGVRYSDGSVFYMHLDADCSGDFVEWSDYGFQYLDRTNALIFRYDNAPHHRDLPSFPDHLHIAGARSKQLLPYGPPTIHELARVVRWHLDHPGERWHPTPH